jgi:hypothetical protein
MLAWENLGRTSAPRLPQAQTKPGSIPDSLT